MKLLIILLTFSFPIAFASHNNSTAHHNNGNNNERRQQRSACQEHRERELRNRQSQLIPECDHNGDYKDKQCQPPSPDRTRFCQCWAPNGVVLSPPSKTTDTCKCHSDRYKALNPSGSTNGNGYDSEGNQRRMIGQFIPECETNGKFRKQQCHGYTGQCWCVDQMTGEQTGESLVGTANCNKGI